MNNKFFNRILNDKTNLGYEVFKKNWGTAIRLNKTTMIIKISEECSVHYHENNTEEYLVLEGKLAVYESQIIEDNFEKTVSNMREIILLPGDRYSPKPKTAHVAVNVNENESIFLELTPQTNIDNDKEIKVYDKEGRIEELNEYWNNLGYEKGLSIKDLISKVKERLLNK